MQQHNLQFIGDYERYRREYSNGSFPLTLQEKKHSVSWPILKDSFSIFNYHNTEITTSRESYFHQGVDLHARPYSDVFAPDNISMAHCMPDDRRPGLCDVFLFSRDLPAVYAIGHLDHESLNEKLKHASLQYEPRVRIEENEPIGKIGNFVWWTRLELSEKEKLLLTSLGTHIHLTFSFYDGFLDIKKNEFNPLLLLKELKI